MNIRVDRSRGEVPNCTDECLTQSLAEVRDRLQSVRETIVRAAPQARETISYRIFAFTQHGHALNFGAFKRPVGLCAGTAENTAFQAELVGYHRAMYTRVRQLHS